MAQEESRLVRFAKDYGWRAYAIPILIVLTIWVFVDVFLDSSDHQPDRQTTSPAVSTSGNSTWGASPDPAKEAHLDGDLAALPPGGAFTPAGDGTFTAVGSPQDRVGQGQEKVFSYTVEIENGINTTGYGGNDAFVSLVDSTLAHPNGWTVDPRFGFEHISIDSGQEPDLRIQLTSAETIGGLCGNELAIETSCFYNDGNRVLINEFRWVRGADPFDGDLGSYRQYVINHEVGHGIGYAEHVACAADGELAPIMMQQTLTLNNSELFRIDPEEVYPDNNLTCVKNPWPYPRGKL